MPKLNVKVKLVGEDGNAHAILGRCERVMRRAGIQPEVRAEFIKEATSSDYNHLLRTVLEWFETDPDEQDEEEE